MRRIAPIPLLAALALALAPAAHAAEDFSPAERAIFMTNQLGNLKPPVDLSYRYAKGGSMEPGFEDDVVLHVKPRADRSCCSADTDFLTGERRLALPEVESAEGNPVVLYFLERDIREMQRLTKGQPAYFRKRIRMAIYQGAQVREGTAQYNGKTVRTREITVAPYVDDPLKDRIGRYAGKRYSFVLSDAVPGGVLSIATRVDGETAGAPPLLTEQITLASPR